MKVYFAYITLTVIGSLLSTGFVYATTVQNNVSVQASTGGNSASGGGLNNGGSEASVFVETTVDGEVVQHVDEAKQSQNGESIEIQKNIGYSSDVVNIQGNVNASVRHKEDNEPEDEEHNQVNQRQVEEQQSDEHLANADARMDEDNTESKPLIARVVEWVQSLFSRFFA